ncbi:hypothetical protein [Rothia amarae]|uniref:hypothetical protein n=1 Tax=Rothia amarae TaxID=169480 RepID=UPI0033D27E99
MQFEDGAVSSVSESGSKVDAVQDDFRTAVQETVKATGVAPHYFKFQGGRPYDASELDNKIDIFSAICGGNAKDGFEYKYSAPVEGNKKYSADEWEAQSEKIRAQWESLGWEVKNVAPGTKDAPGITIGASTPAGVTVLYSVGEGKVDYIDISSPCSGEIPAPSSSASAS